MHVQGLEQALGASVAGFEAAAAAHHARTGRPVVTLCWAQTVDGSTTLRRGSPTQLSGAESGRLTHALRAAHTAILVGIGTVLSDDPLLTVRHVPGPSPQPVILDTTLRLEGAARIVERSPWIYTSGPVDAVRRAALETRGARVVSVASGADGHVDLVSALVDMGRRGIVSLMVEGGASVITAFLRAGLADRAAVTLVPLFAGGYHAVAPLGATRQDTLPRLYRTVCVPVGEDYLLAGSLRP